MKQYLGIDQCGSVIEVEVQDHGIIKGFNVYTLIHPDQSYDSEYYLSMNSRTHRVEIDGKFLETGQAIPEEWEFNITDEMKEAIESAYKIEGCYCSECGMFHDPEQYYDVSYKIIDCNVFCNECVDADDLLLELNEPKDVFKAPSIEGMCEPTSFEEIETLFCDSSGFGSDREPALTRQQALNRVCEILESHDESLFAAITGIGKFQVYVTIYRKVGE